MFYSRATKSLWWIFEVLFSLRALLFATGLFYGYLCDYYVSVGQHYFVLYFPRMSTCRTFLWIIVWVLSICSILRFFYCSIFINSTGASFWITSRPCVRTRFTKHLSITLRHLRLKVLDQITFTRLLLLPSHLQILHRKVRCMFHS